MSHHDNTPNVMDFNILVSSNVSHVDAFTF